MTNTFDRINGFLKDSRFFYTISINLDSVYSYVSPNYDLNFNFGSGSLLGQHFSVTLHPDDLEVCTAAGLRCFQHPQQLIPVTLRKHDGKGGFVTTQWEMQAIPGQGEMPAGVFCVGYNITELMFTKDKLGHARTQLEEIGFIQSHVVRKPLANIMGLAELLSADGNNAEILKLLITSAQELDRVVNEISNKTGSS